MEQPLTFEVGEVRSVSVLKGDAPGEIWVILSCRYLHNNEWFDMKLSLVDALQLLSLLSDMSTKEGFDPLWRTQ